MAVDSLTERERAILNLEQQWWATAAGKEDAIRALGLSPTRYYQLLARLLATERALAYAAVTVNRLGRIVSGHTLKPMRGIGPAVNYLHTLAIGR